MLGFIKLRGEKGFSIKYMPINPASPIIAGFENIPPSTIPINARVAAKAIISLYKSIRLSIEIKLVT